MSKITTQAESTQVTEVPSGTCDNCHAPVQGMYCSQCGQSIESTLKYFWTVVLHILEDVFSFDSRANRTLFPLMFKPGFLTNEYIAGRRVHYVPPLRLYLFVSIVFFISLKLFTINDATGVIDIGNSKSNYQQIEQHLEYLRQQKKIAPAEEQDKLNSRIEKFSTFKNDISKSTNLLLKGMTSELVDLEIKRLNDKELSEEQLKSLAALQTKINKLKAGEDIKLPGDPFSISNNSDDSLTFEFLSEKNNKRLNEFAKILTKKAEKAFKEDPGPLFQEAIEKLPQLLFVLLPLFAALLKVMFIFKKRLYLEHLTVALHSHSFIFFSILLIELFTYTQQYLMESASFIGDILEIATGLLFIWMPIYLFMMQKRVYKQGILLTTVKFIFIGMSYFLMIGLTAAIAFIWGLAST